MLFRNKNCRARKESFQTPVELRFVWFLPGFLSIVSILTCVVLVIPFEPSANRPCSGLRNNNCIGTASTSETTAACTLSVSHASLMRIWEPLPLCIYPRLSRFGPLEAKSPVLLYGGFEESILERRPIFTAMMRSSGCNAGKHDTQSPTWPSRSVQTATVGSLKVL